MDNTGKTVKLCGRTFKTVKSGIDVNEVAACVKELTDEKEALLKRQESLVSLTKLYEKTVIEADSLAKRIQSEAKEQAQKEANEILMQAHERARNMVEEKTSEAMALIQQQVKMMKAEIKGQLSGMMTDELTHIQVLIQDTAHQLSDIMVEKAENLIRNMGKVDLELEGEFTAPKSMVNSPAPESIDIKNVKTVVLDENKNNGNGHNVKDIHMDITPPGDQKEIEKPSDIPGDLPEVENTGVAPKIDDAVFNIELSKPVDQMIGLKTNTQVNNADDAARDGHKKIIISLTAKAKTETEKVGVGSKIWSALTEK